MDAPQDWDTIALVGIAGIGRHGVLDEERLTPQTFKADLDLSVDTSVAAGSDDLADTVDYSALAAEVVAILEGQPVNLIETLAARIADAALAHEQVHRVAVRIHKPEAPVGVPFEDIQVRIVRDRAGSRAAAPDIPEHADAPAPSAAAPAPVPVPTPPAAPEPEPADAHPAPARSARPEPAGEEALDSDPEEPVEVVLALGGNVGDVRATLRSAIAVLEGAEGLRVRTVSPLAKTAAVVQPDAVAQADYLNAVVLATTTLPPRALLELAQGIEADHGRRRAERWGERTLDIDIITYGSLALSDPDLTLPHPRANERAFVLVPWAQADPDAFLAGLGGGPVAALAETAPDRDGVRWLALDWYPGGGRPEQSSPPAHSVPGPAVSGPAVSGPAVSDPAVSGADPDAAPAAPVAPSPPTGADQLGPDATVRSASELWAPSEAAQPAAADRPPQDPAPEQEPPPAPRASTYSPPAPQQPEPLTRPAVVADPEPGSLAAPPEWERFMAPGTRGHDVPSGAAPTPRWDPPSEWAAASTDEPSAAEDSETAGAEPAREAPVEPWERPGSGETPPRPRWAPMRQDDDPER